MSLTMKYILKIKFLILFSFLISCKAYAPTSEKEIYNLINETYSNQGALYYKTLNKSELRIFIEKVDLEIWNNNLSKGLITGGEVSYEDIFNKEDFDLILNQLMKQEQLTLDSKFIKSESLLTRSKAIGVHQISQPVFNKDRSFSLIFRKKFKGGEDIVVYEIVGDEWRVHSVITLSLV